MHITIKHPTGRMKVYPDVLISKMTLEHFRKWVKFFAQYAEDEDIALFKERLEQARRDTAFLSPAVRLVRRLDTMQDELEKALKKERRT